MVSESSECDPLTCTENVTFPLQVLVFALFCSCVVVRLWKSAVNMSMCFVFSRIPMPSYLIQCVIVSTRAHRGCSEMIRVDTFEALQSF